jgi:type III pantothenate kinase
VNLLIDIGNSFGKLAEFDGKSIVQVMRLRHQEIGNFLAEYLANTAIQKIAIASVSHNSLVDEISRLAARHGISCREVQSEKYGFGLINCYQHYQKLGVDRWLAMVAARQRCLRPFLILDLGTAITADLVDEFGQHKGGWILPGYQTMTESLKLKTSKVAVPERRRISSKLSFGITTETCVAAGIQAALFGIFQQALYTAQTVLNSRLPVVVFVTGGDANLLPPLTRNHVYFRENLVLEGLASYCNEQ